MSHHGIEEAEGQWQTNERMDWQGPISGMEGKFNHFQSLSLLKIQTIEKEYPTPLLAGSLSLSLSLSLCACSY
jgi:hypothetical protein